MRLNFAPPGFALLTVVGAACLLCDVARAALPDYDAVIEADAAQGLAYTARLRDSLDLDGSDGVPFDFGAVSGDATFECIAESTAMDSSYVAGAASSQSSLRIAQWPFTGELGMTQRGLADYSFSPPVPTPDKPTHLAWVWDGTDMMRLYANGALAGTCKGITQDFTMPTGTGMLGGNPDGGEAMLGTIYRATVYDHALDPAEIRRHGTAFAGSGAFQPPVIQWFTAIPAVLTTPGPVTLNWRVDGAAFVTINDIDVTGRTNTVFQLQETTSFLLRAVSETGEIVDHSITVPILIPDPSGDPEPPVGHIVINEVMADNTTTLKDAFGEFSDWIELFNPTRGELSLAGMYLTDDPTEPFKWPLPATTLEPGEMRIVFLSGRNLILPTGEWHAGFRLSREGEYLGLTNASGVVHEFAPSIGPQLPDVSFGLFEGDPAIAGLLSAPTPGRTNVKEPPRSGRVGFSRPSGLITDSFPLELYAYPASARIRFRRDSSTTDETYSAPLLIDRTTRITAWSEAPDSFPGDESSASWIMLDPSLQSYGSTLPILVMENFDAGPVPQKGWTSSGANVRQVPRQQAAWIGWDRLGETARTAALPSFFTFAGVRGRGAFSSSWRQKPYSVEIVDEYGRESDASIFGMPAHSEWVLYYPDPDENKDGTLLFNTFVYDLSRRAGRYAPRFRWVELFVNEDGGNVSLSDRRGVYAVLEKVARGSDRLDFVRLSSNGGTGGWLLNINRMDPEPATGWPALNGAPRPQFFRTAGPNRILESSANSPAVIGDDIPQQWNAFLNFDNPGGYTITPAQRRTIEDWFKSFEDGLYDDAIWTDPETGYRRYLDAEDFAEYFVFNVLTRNGDGMLLSMFPWKGNDGRLRMGPAWDYNWSSYFVGGPPQGDLMWRSDQLWYPRLFQDPDFAQLYIDRWFALRRGPMSDAGIDAIIDDQARDISVEKAVLQGIPGADVWEQRLLAMKSWLKERAAWIDSRYVPPPEIAPPGGILPNGATLTVSGSDAVYTTVDGQDPRAPGGSISKSGSLQRSFIFFRTVKLTSRQRAGGRWSAPVSAIYVLNAVPATSSNLAVSEIHYHPAPPTGDERSAGGIDADDFEFVELLNTGTANVCLAGLAFAEDANGNGMRFRFDDGTIWSLEPGKRVVVVRNRGAFTARYGEGIPVAGEYTGSLHNSGDSVVLTDRDGATVLQVTYSDSNPWPESADGRGPSLVLLPGGDPGNAASWRAGITGGTPGAADVPVVPGDDLVAQTLGGHPLEVEVGPATVVVRQRRREESAGTAVTLQSSDNLISWSSHETFLTGMPAGAGDLLMEWTVPRSAGRYLRLSIEWFAPD